MHSYDYGQEAGIICWQSTHSVNMQIEFIDSNGEKLGLSTIIYLSSCRCL